MFVALHGIHSIDVSASVVEERENWGNQAVQGNTWKQEPAWKAQYYVISWELKSPRSLQKNGSYGLCRLCPYAAVFLSRQLISPSPTFWWAWERKRDVSETFVVLNYKNLFDRNRGVAVIKSEIPSSEAAGISHVGWEIIAALVLIREKQNKSCFKASVVLALSI